MKMCKRCGTSNGDSNKFCMECGAPLDVQSGTDTRGQSRGSSGMNGTQGQDFYGGNAGRGPYYSGSEEEIIYTTVAPRSIVMSVILCVVTFGIYFFYWMYHINNDINELAQEPMATGGGTVVVLSIITCGIYTFYWYYKMGEKCDYIAQTRNSSSIIYLILGILGLGIVSVALMQDTINKVLE